MPAKEEKHSDSLQHIFTKLLEKIESIIKQYPLPKTNVSKEHAEAFFYITNIKEYLSRINKLYGHLLKKNTLKAKYHLYQLNEFSKKFSIENILKFTFTHAMKYEFFDYLFQLMQSASKNLADIFSPSFDPSVISLNEKGFKITHKKNPDGTLSYVYEYEFIDDQKNKQQKLYDIAEIYTQELPKILDIIAKEKELYLARTTGTNGTSLSEAELLARCGTFSTNTDSSATSTSTQNVKPSFSRGNA